MRIKFRQGILNYQKSPFFLDMVGNDVYIRANHEHTVIAFAYRNSDFIYAETKDVLGWSGPFDSNVNHWLYWDIDVDTGERTFGKTTVKPTIGQNSLPKKPPADQHTFLKSSKTMKVWNGHYWESKARVFAGKIITGNNLEEYNTKSSQGDLNYNHRAGFLVYDDSGKLLKDNNAIPINTESGLAVQNSEFNMTSLGADIETAKARYSTIPKFRCISWSSFGNNVDTTEPSKKKRCNALTLEIAHRQEPSRILTQGYVTDLLDFSWEDEPNTPIFASYGGILSTEPPRRGSVQRVGYVVDRRTMYFKPSDIVLIDPPNIIDISPTPSPTNTPTPTPTPSVSPTPSITPSVTPSVTPTSSITPTPSSSVTPTPTNSPTPSNTPTPTPSTTPGASPTPTPTPSSVPISDLAFAITYDNKNSTDTISLQSDSPEPLFDDSGMLCDSLNEIYYLNSDLPTWVNAGELSIQATLLVDDVKNIEGRDTAVSLAKIGAIPLLELGAVLDIKNDTVAVGAATIKNSGEPQTEELFREGWRFEYLSPIENHVPIDISYNSSETTYVLLKSLEDDEHKVVKLDSNSNINDSFVTKSLYTSISIDSNDELWVLDHDNKVIKKLDTARCFSTSTEYSLIEYNLTNMGNPISISHITVDSTEYVVLANYKGTSQSTAFIVDQTIITDDMSFDIGDEFKTFKLNVARIKGSCVDVNGNYYINYNGIHFFGNTSKYDLSNFISSGTTDNTLSPMETWDSASAYVRGIAFLNDRLYSCTEGYGAFEDKDNWKCIWSKSPSKAYEENTISLLLNRNDATSEIWLNGESIMTKPSDSDINIDQLTLGSDNVENVFSGKIKNVYMKNRLMDITDYENVISGIYENENLTKYELTINNHDASNGTASWVDETGSLETASEWLVPYSSTEYFKSSSNTTIASQEIDLVNNGISQTDISSGELWIVLEWWQSGKEQSTDKAGMGIRQKGPNNTEIAYSKLIDFEHGNSRNNLQWRRRYYIQNVKTFTEKIDIIMHFKGKEAIIDQIKARVLKP